MRQMTEGYDFALCYANGLASEVMKRKSKERRRDLRGSVRRIFLLSPANASGIRAKMIGSENARFDLAMRLRQHGASLGEVFSFISGLYFRGKLAYAQVFSDSYGDRPGAYVITASAGLIPPDTPVTLERLREISAVSIDVKETRYRGPLERDARAILDAAGESNLEVVLLGSIATPKYVEPLLEVFGERLVFPAEFVGRGDMSRGGLLLRKASAGEELKYVPVATAVRHGPRPPKLPKSAKGLDGAVKKDDGLMDSCS
jgi:hypothetical protein